MKNILFILFVLPSVLLSQEKDTLSTASKIDSIYALQKKMYNEIKNEPLANKKYGFEFNLFRLFLIDKYLSFSGTFSLFAVNRNIEIAFPFYYQKPKEERDLTEFTIDGHIRYFLGKAQNGFYISGITRFAYLHGTLGEGFYDLYGSDKIGKEGSEEKFGIGIGLGYRVFSYKGLYWGVSAGFGRYLIGNNNKFEGKFLIIDDDNEFFLDVEILKFGWAF